MNSIEQGNFDAFRKLVTSTIEASLEHWLPPREISPTSLHEAMRYSALSNGKYIRPLLVFGTGYALNVDKRILRAPATAIELIHTYSLVQDDLPAMDDDDLRRGRATTHKKFGEAIAILCGDALHTLAFHILAKDPSLKVSPINRLKMVDTLSVASGSLGMIGGQVIDLEAEGKKLDIEELENMHHHKTGALIQASVSMACLCKEHMDESNHRNLSRFAHCVGLAFQIKDDLLDIEGDTETLGKPSGSDIALNKVTYPKLLGEEGARKKAKRLHEEALKCIECLGDKAWVLQNICDLIVNRNR